jgi:hypothetical protein
MDKNASDNNHNAIWNLGASSKALRRPDHRFEWNREEFRLWSNGIAERFGYKATFLPVGQEDPKAGPPTQMVVFERAQS